MKTTLIFTQVYANDCCDAVYEVQTAFKDGQYCTSSDVPGLKEVVISNRLEDALKSHALQTQAAALQLNN